MQLTVQTESRSHKDDGWYAILDASQTLLDAAKMASWEELSGLAVERDLLIRAYFSKPITVDNALQIRDKITQLLAMDDQVLGLARKEQDNLLPVLKTMSRNKKAIGAYQQVGG